ncbi:MAG: hypothetical protein HOW73_02375 [Polyangiaceae bacterium]|nr:hypothetical protein [Polyangiaceae bacterium]
MRAASRYEDLVFHGLAFVPPATGASAASRAASLYAPAYVAFAQGHMQAEAWSLFIEDAPVLSRLFAPVAVAHAIGFLAELHDEIGAFRAASRRPLDELAPEDVSSRVALQALRSLPREPVEILRSDLALAATAFDTGYEAFLAPHAMAIREVVDARRSVLGAPFDRLPLDEVHLSTTLGPRGRVFGSRVVVGTEALPGQAVDPDPILVLAVHEHVVHLTTLAFGRRGRAPGWAEVEAVALSIEERLFIRTPLERAFEAWSGVLDRSGLADAAREDLVELCAEVARVLDVDGSE